MWNRNTLESVHVVVFCIVLCSSLPFTVANVGYLVVLPKVFRPNVEEVLSVTILKPTEPIYVQAKLFSKTGHLLAETGHEIFGKGTLKIKIPMDAKGVCTLKICGNCVSTREGSFSFYNSSLVTIEEKGISVFLQTDKPVYKPGQTVHINAFMTGPDLKPVKHGLVLSILDPNKTQITKWTSLDGHLCCGLINVSFPLSDQPVLGVWTLMARIQGHTYKRHFEVLKYVLPKFEVTIDAPPFIRDWNICKRIQVSARYTFGQDVHGMVKIQAAVHGIGYYGNHISSTVVQRSKIDGTAVFNICVSDLIQTRLPDHFRGQLHLVAEVTTPDGSTVRATDDSCPVNKQLVDLRFSRDTRTTFKPGLPFKGRVLVQYPDGSLADNVTVFIETSVDGIDFSRQSAITSHGHAQFYIPPLPTIAQSMTISAKVISIDEELVPESYFSAYLTVNSWYSPSKCHLLIESKRHQYKVGEEGRFMIHSTCPCNLDMYYEVKARGNIVHSGIHFSRHQHKHMNPTADTSKLPIFFQHLQNERYGAKTCTVFIKFLITHEMAPVSRLIVYYIRPGGEGVADAIVFETEPDFRNKMSIELSDRDAMPGEDIKLRIRTDPGSCVCLGAVDKSVYLLRPDYILSKKDIFQELETYDFMRPEKASPQYEGRRFDYHHGHISKRSSLWEPLYRRVPVRDAQYAFEECGLLVMTDTVSLHFRQESQEHDGLYFEGPSFDYQIAQLMAEQREIIHRKRTRVYFPETWIWTCFNTSATRKDHPVVVHVPDSITTWMFTGVSLSPTQGFSLASPVNLRTFQFFFLDFTLPYSVIRDEQIKIPLVVHNYLHACVRVHLQLHVPSTMEVLHGKETLKKFCIGNEETKTLFYDMVFRELGIQKISATAEAYADSRCCSGILSDESPNKRFLTGMDSVKKQILVEPEGIPRYYTQSVYFCPNSRIQISTPNKYQYQYLAKPSEMTSFTFNVKAKNDARIALSPGPKDPYQMIEVVIGGNFNQDSWIMKSENGNIVSRLSTPGILSEVEFRPFWITWKHDLIRIGFGDKIDNNRTVFLSYEADRPIVVEYIGFSTGWGSEGDFTIWNRKETDDSGYGEVMYLGLPDSAIRGSAFARAKLTGDIMAPNLHNMDQLLRLPQGCGEQNMANFAPNVYILQYLDKTRQLKPGVKRRALELLTKGYQRQLTYKRPDGSYSAFGLRDSMGNTWLSAFVLKTLSQARDYIYIDKKELEQTKSWIMSTQRKDGSFQSVGRIINKEIQGGLSGRIALTAYVLTAFQSVGMNTKVEMLSAYSAGKYLENNAHLITEPYTASLTAYALSLLNIDSSYSVMKLLAQKAIKRNGMTFWRLYHHDMQEFHVFNEDPSKAKACSAEIEIAGYAALSYLTKDDLSSTFPIVKWLMTQRNSYGGFLSTQDTVVALQALSQYAIQSFTSSLSMAVSLASTNMDLLEKFHLNSNNSDLIQTVVIPSLPARLFLSASGEGCAMFQVEVQYNVPDPTDHPAFDLWLRLHQRISSRRHYQKPEVRLTLDICTKWLHPGSSNMAVLEVFIMSGYAPDVESLEKLLEKHNLKLKRYEVTSQKVNLYFDEIQSRCFTCLSFDMIRKYKVESGSPVPVRVFDYYEPSYAAERLYNGSYLGSQSSSDMNDTGCPSGFGCNDYFPDTEAKLCSCYQECQDNVTEVCASDGSSYRNLCTMEIYACQKDMHLEAMPKDYCEVRDTLPDDPEEAENMFKLVTTTSWRDLLASSFQNEVSPTTGPNITDNKQYYNDTDTTVTSLDGAGVTQSTLIVNSSQTETLTNTTNETTDKLTTTDESDWSEQNSTPAIVETRNDEVALRNNSREASLGIAGSEIPHLELDVEVTTYSETTGAPDAVDNVTTSSVRSVTTNSTSVDLYTVAYNFTDRYDTQTATDVTNFSTQSPDTSATGEQGNVTTWSKSDNVTIKKKNYYPEEEAQQQVPLRNGTEAENITEENSVYENSTKTQTHNSLIKILQPTTMMLLQPESMKAELSQPEWDSDGNAATASAEPENYTQPQPTDREEVTPEQSSANEGDTVLDRELLKDVPALSGSSYGGPNYKLDLSQSELSSLNDSVLEKLLSGSILPDMNAEVNQSHNQGHSLDEEQSKEMKNNNERLHFRDNNEEDNGTVEGEAKINTNSGYVEKEPNSMNDPSDSDQEEGVSNWLREGLSDKDILAMLSLYNSLDSSESDRISQDNLHRIYDYVNHRSTHEATLSETAAYQTSTQSPEGSTYHPSQQAKASHDVVSAEVTRTQTDITTTGKEYVSEPATDRSSLETSTTGYDWSTSYEDWTHTAGRQLSNTEERPEDRTTSMAPDSRTTGTGDTTRGGIL